MTHLEIGCRVQKLVSNFHLFISKNFGRRLYPNLPIFKYPFSLKLHSFGILDLFPSHVVVYFNCPLGIYIVIFSLWKRLIENYEKFSTILQTSTPLGPPIGTSFRIIQVQYAPTKS